ncbi:AAA domain-containing protein [Streptomyces sp. NPDC048521]|uniref:bifunctional RecB family nuclease/DEAD/DEAH box helicase n=1 Tax=Streptomyces sp. NPDC048521 TaxID=3365566 RepID=UPI0037232D05
MRQLALNIAADEAARKDGINEVSQFGMPAKQKTRPGIQLITKAGRDWEAKKFADIEQTFPAGTLVGNARTTVDPTTGSTVAVGYSVQDLAAALPKVSPGHFLVEAQYEVSGSFVQAFAGGLPNLSFAMLRPDLIQVRDASSCPSNLEVLPDGHIRELDAEDARLRLRVIDIKLTSEPTPGYYAEVTYYAIALAGWLVDNALTDRFVVTADAAVWPGSHEAAAVRRAQEQATAGGGSGLTPADLARALEDDLETVPFEVFSLWLRQFFSGPLAEAVAAGAKWRDLPWHVDNRCRNCDWLGQKWYEDGEPSWAADHCIPTAEADGHLSRVAFLGRGAAEALRQGDVENVPDLATLTDDDEVYEQHQSLRAGRTVIGSRARVLTGEANAAVIPNAGTSAVMPAFANLRLRVATYFDVGSGITLAFALNGYWVKPDRSTKAFPTEVYIVERKDLSDELERLQAFLARINQILEEVHTAQGDATYQVYIWDQAQYEHLTRVIGRHLNAIVDPQSGIADLAWLFPPENLAPNPRMATRRSPITVVRDAVRALVGAPVAHYYSLLELAKVYQPTRLERAFDVNPHPMFQDPLSDQIPSERAHEIWTKVKPRPATAKRPAQRRDYQQVISDLRRNVDLRIRALQLVTDRLGEDLKGVLKAAAPEIRVGPLDNVSKLASDSHLWLGHCQLNAAIQEVEVYTSRAMPVHEREARFRAARLPSRIIGDEAAAILRSRRVDERPGVRVYEIGAGSREMKIKDGDIGFCISSAEDPTFLDRPIFPLKDIPGMPELRPWEFRWRLDSVTECNIVAFDRSDGYVILELRNPQMVEALERVGLASFERDVVLDQKPVEFLTRRVQAALAYIGNPLIAQQSANRDAARATGQERRRRGARTSPLTCAGEVLWGAQSMLEQSSARNMVAAEKAASQLGELNPSQRAAWIQALTRRMSLIWGPPGTGKSHTLRAIIVSALAAAAEGDQPIRILVTGPTYTAVDNVVGASLIEALQKVVAGQVHVARVRSPQRSEDEVSSGINDVPVDSRNPAPELIELLNDLTTSSGLTLVAATPQQASNLTVAANGVNGAGDTPGAHLFDMLIIDEASQVDVATSTLPLIALADGASVIVCGDDLQMPPIHSVAPPRGLEAMVESIYTFLRVCRDVVPTMLSINYRSCEDIVGFVRRAGYAELESHSPDMRMALVSPLPEQKPTDWPASLPFSPSLSVLLDPSRPASSFVYSEGLASQWNAFEAQATAAMIRLLYGRLASQVSGEKTLGVQSGMKAVDRKAATAQEFFTSGVGVVTPHRAQQSLVVSELVKAFEGVPEVTEKLLREAVDTVERYQGQQRDVIIATMALGDPDAIANEDEFLFNLRRFNVMISRARAKVVVLSSREVETHMPGDPKVLEDCRLLKAYLGLYCDRELDVELSWFRRGSDERAQVGSIRWHG